MDHLVEPKSRDVERSDEAKSEVEVRRRSQNKDNGRNGSKKAELGWKHGHHVESGS